MHVDQAAAPVPQAHFSCTLPVDYGRAQLLIEHDASGAFFGLHFEADRGD